GNGAPVLALAFGAAGAQSASTPPSIAVLEQETSADRADRLFATINKSLRTIESEQLERINSLTESAYQTADAITEALEAAGLPVDGEFGQSGVGGPLIALESPALFETKVKELDETLERLDGVKERARRLPIANPAPGRSISSTFG